MSKHSNINTRIYLNPGAVRVGAMIGETMRHAADKQAHVDDLTEKLLKKRLSGLGRASLLECELELSYQKEKLAFRTGEADEIIAADLDVKLIDLESGRPIAQGLLTKADYRTGILTVADDSLQEVAFVSNVPAPEGATQTYFGRRLTTAFEVTSVPRENQRVIRLR